MEKKSYIVSYDLADGGDYDKLFEKLKSYSGWAHITESTWAVLTTKEASEIRDEIGKILHSTGDENEKVSNIKRKEEFNNKLYKFN